MSAIDHANIDEHDHRGPLNLDQDGHADPADPVTPVPFATLLQQMRATRNLSKADLAKRTGVDPSTITRFEQGSRAPERATILDLAKAMVLPMIDRDRLLAAAGFRSELWDDPALVELAQLLNEPSLPETARAEARSVIRMATAYLKLQRLKDA